MKQMTKNKTLVYALSSFGMALLFGLLSGLVFDYLPGYIVLWSFFGAILGSSFLSTLVGILAALFQMFILVFTYRFYSLFMKA